ncbi:hypothetical protein DFH08DRAFT_966463 [Mycena albidolilacea]|uniref:Uncharacterized protein n=1 Tax=Mycena albidolilacea TaxID=1033008 RepID=A0AAD7EJN2_9AGAR|nr:hypothetical protein DFH08DRAFT_966463 [Mycena albidolilacea]
MVFSKVFAPLFTVVLATVVNTSPVASPEANALAEITTGWGGICTTISAANACNNLPG